MTDTGCERSDPLVGSRMAPFLCANCQTGYGTLAAFRSHQRMNAASSVSADLEAQAVAYALEVGCSRELLEALWREESDLVFWLQRASVMMEAAEMVRGEA